MSLLSSWKYHRASSSTRIRTTAYKSDREAKLSAQEPAWGKWLIWAYTLLNAAAFTPLVDINSITIGAVIFVSINMVIMLYYLQWLARNIRRDIGMRGRHFIRLGIIATGAWLGAHIGLAAVPATAPWLLTTLILANFMSTFVNIFIAASELVIPLLTHKLHILWRKLRRKPLPYLPPTPQMAAFDKNDQQVVQRLQHHHKGDQETVTADLKFGPTLVNACYRWMIELTERFAGSKRYDKQIAKFELWVNQLITQGRSADGSVWYHKMKTNKLAAVQNLWAFENTLTTLQNHMKSNASKSNYDQLRSHVHTWTHKIMLTWGQLSANYSPEQRVSYVTKVIDSCLQAVRKKRKAKEYFLKLLSISETDVNATFQKATPSQTLSTSPAAAMRPAADTAPPQAAPTPPAYHFVK